MKDRYAGIDPKVAEALKVRDAADKLRSKSVSALNRFGEDTLTKMASPTSEVSPGLRAIEFCAAVNAFCDAAGNGVKFALANDAGAAKGPKK